MWKKGISIVLVLLWMGFIFFNSAKNGEESGNMSREIITITVETFTEIEDNTPEMEHWISVLSYPVRKGAHFFLYFVLGLLVMNMFFHFGIEKKGIGLAIFLCILYAMSDEWHQTFIHARSGQISDVCLDSIASLLSIGLFYWCRRRNHGEE